MFCPFVNNPYPKRTHRDAAVLTTLHVQDSVNFVRWWSSNMRLTFVELFPGATGFATATNTVQNRRWCGMSVAISTAGTTRQSRNSAIAHLPRQVPTLKQRGSKTFLLLCNLFSGPGFLKGLQILTACTEASQILCFICLFFQVLKCWSMVEHTRTRVLQRLFQWGFHTKCANWLKDIFRNGAKV